MRLLFALVFDMDISEHRGYRDFTWAVELNRFGLQFVGLWPKTNQIVKDDFACNLRVGIIFVIVTFVSIIPLFCSLTRVWGNMILMIDNIQVILPLLVVTLKLIIMRKKRTVLSSLVKMMAEDWTKLRKDAERDVMIRRVRTARQIVIFGYVLMLFAFTLLIILPAFDLPFRHVTNLTDRNRILPLQTYYFYDTDKSPQYELTYIGQGMTMFFGAIVYTSVDSFLGLAIFHICGQLENFKRRLDDPVLCKNFDKALKCSVENHLRLIRFAANIEDIFNLMMLGLVFYFGIEFCLYGFLFLTILTDDGTRNIPFSQMCFAIIGIVTLLAHTFLYCCAGELIAEQCAAVYRAICNLAWYELEPKTGRTLILLLLRANEPFRITAGKIIPLTMTTFCSLLKTSAGYISFLLAKRS